MSSEYLYDGVLPLDQSSFENRLADVEERIQRALLLSGRSRSDVTLVAVTKKFSSENILIAYRSGLRHFGENYVQEFAEKRPELGELQGVTYHLIGHLQSNKARLATELFMVIQTVDSPKLLRRLNDAAGNQGKTVEALLEIKLSDEMSKSGAGPEAISAIVQAAADCPNVNLTGLMTIPPFSEDPEDSRPYFRKLAALGKEYQLTKLSMGMSADFEIAIEEGATAIRVGTALFGKRPRPAAASPSR
ncbi:MAG: YggS family pyridoxal phosphate-dependent enzyme [Bryobacteraceae bacterium]